jgi:hypothetical protein
VCSSAAKRPRGGAARAAVTSARMDPARLIRGEEDSLTCGRTEAEST